MPRSLEELIAPNVAPTKVAGGFGAVEGPVFSRLGYLLFSDTPAMRIMKWEERQVSVFRENNGSSGLTFDHQGRLLACEHARVTRTEKDGKITVLADHVQESRDLVYAIDGSTYFSRAEPQLGVSEISQITRHGELRVAAHDFMLPSAVALAPKQQKLYAADTAGGNIWVYDITADGALRG